MKKQLGILAIAVAMALSSFASAAFADIAPMENNRYVFIPVANESGVKYNYDYPYYASLPDSSYYTALPGAADNTYFLKADGGGLNEMHIASSSSLAFGDITNLTSQTTSPSGSFYITNTGGRGFDDNLIVLLSVTGTVSNSFSANIKSSGYSWSIPPGGTYQPTTPTDAEYVSGINETFTKADFQYGPQTMKPGPGALGLWSLPFYYGQDVSDSSTASYLMFIDLYVGNIKDGGLPFMDEHGAAKVEFSLSGLTPGSTVAFNAYGWCSAANQGEGISWTNRTNGTDFSSSSYSITVDPNAPAPVPIPAAFWLLGSGFSGMFFLRRRKSISC
jgi:hypothetical protein